MDVLGDAIDRDRRSSAIALRAPATGRSYDYRRFCTNAWKIGNFLRHHGVRSGAGIGIADDPIPEPVLTFYGAAVLGAVVDVAPNTDASPRALVVPEPEVDSYDPEPGTKLIAYGNRHENPSVAYFERDIWSENPTQPPDHVAPEDPLVTTDGRTYTHGEILAAAERVVDAEGLGSDDDVAVHGSFSAPGVVAAGLVAPIVAGGTIVLGTESAGDLVVGGPNSDVATDTLLES
jgi:hypothetical protein